MEETGLGLASVGQVGGVDVGGELMEDWSNLPASAAEARDAGATLYVTGRPCRHGHTAPRYTSNRRCVACSAEGARRRNERLSRENRCHYCGAETEGQTRCAACWERAWARDQARRERLRQDRRCWWCGTREAEEGRSACPSCAERARQAAHIRYWDRRGRQVCVQCETPLLDPAHALCGPCLDRADEYRAAS